MPLSCSTPAISVDSSRKSRRLQKREIEDDDDTSIFVDSGFPRGTITPSGTQRIPFSFPKKANDQTSREQRKLMGLKTDNFKYNAPKNNKVLVGNNHQANVEEFVERDGRSRDESPEREEQMWKPEEDDNGEYDFLRNVYWKIVWRQFEGQIPFDWALQNLWKNKYDVAMSLENVDQYLKVVPQKFKPLATVQFNKFEKLWKKKNTGNRHIQETAMRNYHFSEIQQYYHDYKRLEKTVPGACNCKDPLVQDLGFQPRWACSNCTKNHRTNRLPSDLLCLLCINYTHMTGNSRPVSNPVFLDEELQKIQSWDKLEGNQERRISKEEFEEIQKNEKMDRLKKNDLTEEEQDIMDGTQLSRKKKNLSEEEQNKLGEKLMEQLEEHPLPLYRVCQCGSGNENVEVQKILMEKYIDEVVMLKKGDQVAEVSENVEVVQAVESISNKKAKGQKRRALSKFDEDLKQLPVKRERKQKVQHDV